MTRESVPANTKGTAEFQIVENMPLLTGPGALTMEINQVQHQPGGFAIYFQHTETSRFWQ